MENKADYLLRAVPNVKIGNVQKPVDKKHVKQEVQVLRFSDETEVLVMETLRYIHGHEFALKEQSTYEDTGPSFSKKYFMEKDNLVIKGVFDYSKNNEPESEEERLRMFALLRLESYGFHKNHCVEAMEYCNFELEDALNLLYSKYFNTPKYQSNNHSEGCSVESNLNHSAHGYSENELMEFRQDEKLSLESIFEETFVEKVKNSVWILTLQLDYLVKCFSTKKETVKNIINKETVKNHKGKQERCRYSLTGNCKFGANCRFLHTVEEPTVVVDEHLDNSKFELEIRFLPNTKYPYEPPVIFLKTNAALPELMTLHICKRLYQEAENLARDGFPCVYSLVDLLKNEDDMKKYLRESRVNFLLPTQKLFPTPEEEMAMKARPSHYKRGTTGRDNRKKMSMHELLEEDKKIADRHRAKVKDPKYIKMCEVRDNLPAHALKNNILNTIKSSQIIVISGETGCGKSTQVPQFILDDWLNNFEGSSKHVEIVCTQPRRISAIGVAERVSEERIERVGNTIGYQIRLENKISGNTRLTFCTTGILLRRLEEDPKLSSVSHVIVDEVHERSEESDFLLLILRDLLPLRRDLKVVLMSATLNADLFSNYFGGIPILEIPGRTFPVEQFFLEDIFDLTGYVIEEGCQFARPLKMSEEDLDAEIECCDVSSANAMPSPNVRDENLSLPQILARYKGYSVRTCKNMFLMDYERINFELIEEILMWIVRGDHDYPRIGSILIFLPGISEITALYDQLCDHSEFSPRHGKYILLPLHSSLTSEEQSAIFRKPKEGVRKIILSTNLAETSVTIDDCVFVIDSGKMKEKRFDANRNMESLDTVWVTRANAIQRKGRAGRVTSGVCIHLFTKHRFENHILSQPIPEIQRIPLEQLLLNIKILRNFEDKDVHQVLNRVLEPPKKESIDSAIVRLQHVGAFDLSCNLTALGIHLAMLPVDVRIGKLILFGAILGCVDAALTIAACLSYKSPFVTPFGKKEEANAKKREFSMGYSDHLTTLRAYQKFQEANNRSYMAGVNFCNENFLSRKTLVTLADTKHQFLELLVSIGFIPVDLKRKYRSGEDHVLALTGSEFNSNGNNIRVLTSILCSALYPNVVKVLSPEKSYMASSVGAVLKLPNAKELKFRTKDDQVFLHPSSVNYSVKNFPSPFLVYQEKVKTSKVFIRDCSMVPAIPLLLFSGFDVKISVNGGDTFLLLDDRWIVFKVEHHRIAEMIKTIRLELQELLEEKIKDPLLNLLHHDKGERIIATILKMISDC